MSPAQTGPDGKPVRLFRDQPAFESWLEKNHDASTGLWLKLAKKASGKRSVSYDEALEVALCFGWIDGQGKGLDESYSLQKFTPRAKRSMWSKRNVGKALALIESGRMRPPGLAEVNRARADGRWDAAYDSPSTSTVPDDFREALARSGLRGAFDALDSRNRYAMLHRLQTAKRPETRRRRLEGFVDLLAKGEKLNS